ncbi:ShlB/FhaC/HecB family hemolysin secretion/activation protein [Bacillus sp. NP157]|nr:ShlB/FhaC/HecB family hemolysin secretion/activation protein [Bacillus sp. NP157]
MSNRHYIANTRCGLASMACAAAVLAGASSPVGAVALEDIDTQERRARTQREAKSRDDQRAQPAVRLGSAPPADFHRTDLPVENECFRIDAIVLDGFPGRAFDFARRYLRAYVGRCMGHDGINLVVRRVSDLIIDRGYVTTRVGLAPQDIHSGVLRITLVPATVRAVRFAPGSASGFWRTALPSRVGGLLNLRDIEQGLEQFKRVPSQDVTIDIAPGDVPGESDLVVSIARTRPWHVVATLDDTGSRATGRLQGGLQLGLDNPLRINDVLTLGYNHDVGRSRGHGTRGNSANYAVPLGNGSASISLYDYHYHQTVTGSQQAFLSSGKSRSVDLTLQRLLHRTAYGKTSLELRVGKRLAHNFIEGTELVSQQRHVATAELALVQRQFVGRAQVDLRIARRQGLHALGGQRDAANLPAGYPTFQYRMGILDASLSLPFSVGGAPLQWTSELRAQRSGDVLYASEFITVGGRYSVRGFDGEQNLAGEKGWYWRNTLSAPLGSLPVAVYLGIDGGHVGGPSIKALPDKTLRGAFAGVRGGAGPLNVDFFAGWAGKGGRALQTVRPATGFQLVYQY